MTTKRVIVKKIPVSSWNVTAFSNLIPWVSGMTSATFCKPVGKISYGTVAPERKNIGKKIAELIAPVAFSLGDKLATINPMAWIETITNK